MVKGALVDRLADVGRKLVELLDEANLNVTSALWLYRTEASDWILLLAFPEVERFGPRAFYEKIQRVFASNRKVLEPLTLQDIVVMGPSEPLLQLLKGALQTGPGLSEIRFTGNRINNTLIEDALIYRLQ